MDFVGQNGLVKKDTQLILSHNVDYLWNRDHSGYGLNQWEMYVIV